jgi:hypothetical protein
MLTRDADILEYTGEDILPADQNQPPDLLLFQSTRLRAQVLTEVLRKPMAM